MRPDEAIWKMNEFAKAIRAIEEQLQRTIGIIHTLEGIKIDPVQQWKIIHPLSKSLKITIRKSPQRITNYSQLTMKEIWSRVNFRSCSDGLCQENHCSECGLCEVRLGDAHDCNPPLI